MDPRGFEMKTFDPRVVVTATPPTTSTAAVKAKVPWMLIGLGVVVAGGTGYLLYNRKKA